MIKPANPIRASQIMPATASAIATTTRICFVFIFNSCVDTHCVLRVSGVMKFLLCFSLLFVLTALGDPPPRDGNFWQRLHPIQRQMWAGGWMDGLCTGELVAKEVGSCEAYH